MALCLAAQNRAPVVSEYPAPLIREEQMVVVDGVAEVWRLQWAAPPVEACGRTDDSLTCPCAGFAFGEGGDADLIRTRRGADADRLHLAPFFTGDRFPTIQRWPVEDSDLEAFSDPNFAAKIARRPVVQAMHFGDYDHDGQSTEFFLQTETQPCSRRAGIVVGISKGNRRLHAFGTRRHPDKPLMMLASSWEGLRVAKGPVEILEWPCGDHGGERQEYVRLSWTAAGIEGTRRAFACTPEGKSGPLLSEAPL